MVVAGKVNLSPTKSLIRVSAMQVLITENDKRARTITSFLLKPNQTKNLVTYYSKKVTKTDFFTWNIYSVRKCSAGLFRRIAQKKYETTA